MREERRHSYEGWINGRRRCRITVCTYSDTLHWQSTHVETCTEHPPLLGKYYEKPAASRISTECDDYECCSNHERNEKLIIAAYFLGKSSSAG